MRKCGKNFVKMTSHVLLINAGITDIIAYHVAEKLNSAMKFFLQPVYSS